MGCFQSKDEELYTQEGLGIDKKSVEYSFFDLAFRIIDNAGFTVSLQDDFHKAVRQRDKHGKINWRLMRQLNENSYTKVIKWTEKKLKDSCTQNSESIPSREALIKLREEVDKICDHRKRELNIGRNRGDDRDIISKHQYALDIWVEMNSTIDKLLTDLNNSSCTIL